MKPKDDEPQQTSWITEDQVSGQLDLLEKPNTEYRYSVKFTGKEPAIFVFNDWTIAVDTVARLCGRKDVESVEPIH